MEFQVEDQQEVLSSLVDQLTPSNFVHGLMPSLVTWLYCDD